MYMYMYMCVYVYQKVSLILKTNTYEINPFFLSLFLLFCFYFAYQNPEEYNNKKIIMHSSNLTYYSFLTADAGVPSFYEYFTTGLYFMACGAYAVLPFFFSLR